MIVEISASILSLDWSDQTVVDQAVMRISNANYVHFDIEDGKFVKEKSYNHELVAATNTGHLKKDVHLMIKAPEKAVDKYIKAGASILSFHAEAVRSPKKLIEKIKSKGVLAGLAISPETPVKKVEKYLPDADYALVMTVHPGKGGQKLIKKTITKVRQLRKKYPHLLIEVDGGINDKNAGELVSAGANIIVSGSYIFNSPNPKVAIDILRNA